MIVPAEKSYIREKHLKKREATAPDMQTAWSRGCSERMYQTIRMLASEPVVIGGYAAIKAELDVMHALTLLAQDRYPLALPVMGKEDGKRHLTFHTWEPGGNLTKKTYGIYEPDGDKDAVIPDIVIVPLLAFDRRGHRLGYGGGYYDGMLRKLRAVRPQAIAIGAAFSQQEEEALPNEAYDQILNKIVTEKEVISIR